MPLPKQRRADFAVQSTISVDHGQVVEEHWVIHRFFPESTQEVVQHIELLRRLKRTGQITINMSQGGLHMMEYRERGSQIAPFPNGHEG